MCHLPFLPCLPNPDLSESDPSCFPFLSPALLVTDVVLPVLNDVPHCGQKQIVMHCSGTLSLLLFLSPSFTFSPPVFLGTQVFQEFYETFIQAVQVCTTSVCQKALSGWLFPKSPSTFANKTAERELIYHSVITTLGHERAIPRMNYGSIQCPMHPGRQGKQMLRCVSCQPLKQLTFVTLINSLLC